jgi:RimJ/RimL family protein N-acetyltransferase
VSESDRTGQRRQGPTGTLAPPAYPTLTVATPRLQVHQLALGDAPAVAEIFDDKQTRRWLPFPPECGDVDPVAWCTELAAERRGRGAGDHYGMIRREDEALVGCLWTKHTDWLARITEVAYAVAPVARGFGLAAEAVDGVAIALLLEHGFQRVELRVAPGNLGSRRVAEKAGFTYEGLLRNAGQVHSGRVDLEVWSLVAADLR